MGLSSPLGVQKVASVGDNHLGAHVRHEDEHRTSNKTHPLYQHLVAFCTPQEMIFLLTSSGHTDDWTDFSRSDTDITNNRKLRQLEET